MEPVLDMGCGSRALLVEALRALRPGGSFIYVPGLPEWEAKLSSGYAVERWEVIHGVHASRIRRTE